MTWSPKLMSRCAAGPARKIFRLSTAGSTEHQEPVEICAVCWKAGRFVTGPGSDRSPSPGTMAVTKPPSVLVKEEIDVPPHRIHRPEGEPSGTTTGAPSALQRQIGRER